MGDISDTLEITPIQDLPFTEGELAGNYTKVNSGGMDSSGGEFQSEVKVTNTLSATWIPLGQSNRFTSYTPKDCENSQTMKFLKMVMLQSMDIRKMLLQIIVIIQQERQFISQMKKHFTIINPMEH